MNETTPAGRAGEGKERRRPSAGPACAGLLTVLVVAGCAGAQVRSADTGGTVPETSSVPETAVHRAELEPSRDTTLIEDPAGDLGAGEAHALFVGRMYRPPFDRRRALLAFDVAAALPAGARVESAELTLQVTKSFGGGPLAVELRPVRAAWGEGEARPDLAHLGAPATAGEATWTASAYGEKPWSHAGGDLAPRGSAVADVPDEPGPVTWRSAAMAEDVQGWLDDPASNHGWALVAADESTEGSLKRLTSRESVDLAARPRLVITWR
jgi:hypothetical protein